MTVKKYILLFLFVLSLFVFPVSAASFDWDDALVFADDGISMGESYSDPWAPVSGDWYRLVSVNPDNGNVYIDVVVQCVDSELYDPVSGSGYFVYYPEVVDDVQEDPYGVFYFDFLIDDDGFGYYPAYCGIFPAKRPEPPVENSVTSGLYVAIHMIGSIISSMLNPSGELFPLTVILCVGIAISLLMFAIYVLHKWLWGL